MKTLTALSRQELLSQTERLVSEERRITAELIRHLAELERRRLYSEMGFGSMFDLLTKHYKFSEGAASRRISAMRLARKVPQVAASIESGAMSLSVASQVQHFIQAERKSGITYSTEQTRDLTREMEGKSRRECERRLLELSPASALPKERERQITPTQVEIRFIANEKLAAKFEKLRALFAHQGNLSYAELFEKLADEALKKHDPEQQVGRAQAATQVTASPAPPARRTASPPAELHLAMKHRPHIRAEDRRIIWQRAAGQCEYRDPQTGRRCDSRWALEVDHIRPFAQGGPHEPSNFRLVCRAHNQFLAVQAFGPAWMKRYLRE